MKPTDLTPEEIALVLKNRGQTPPPAADPDPKDPAPEFTGEQVAVLRCVDALSTALEIYVPPGTTLQARLAQAQLLLLEFAGLTAPAEDAEGADPVAADDAAEPPESPDSYTVG